MTGLFAWISPTALSRTYFILWIHTCIGFLWSENLPNELFVV